MFPCSSPFEPYLLLTYKFIAEAGYSLNPVDMPRFAPDEPTSSPTSTMVNDTPVPVQQDEEAARPSRAKWYRTMRSSDDEKKKAEKEEELERVESVDGVWGKHVEGTPNYKNVGW